MGHPFLSSFAFFVSFIHSVAIIATIQPTSYVPPSLGLTLLPICPVCCDSVATITHPVGLTDSEITSRLQLYSRISYRLFPLLQLVGLFRCRFGSTTRLPQCYNMSAYLPGLHAARPSAFVEGAGVEPAAHPKRSWNHRMRYGVRGFKPFHLSHACLCQLSRLLPSLFGD